MGNKYLRQLVFVIFFVSAITFPAFAGAPTQRIKSVTDELILIVLDEELNKPENDAIRAKRIRSAVDRIFDWEAFSQRALARHWRKRSPEEKKEFVLLFGRLIEETYMDRTKKYSGEKAVFLKETIDGNYGIVEAKIITKYKREVKVSYKVRKKENGWLVYDVYVEGVSLVKNYRNQFNDIIMKSSYNDLVIQLKDKIQQIQ